MKKLLFIFLMLAVLTGCHGLRMGVGLKGEYIDEDTLVLDGDTFTIQERIGDSLFIVWNYEHSDEKTPCYLLKYERNGFYYPQIGATNITSIDSTEALHLSAQEVEVFRGVLAMIEQELHRAIDKHTRELIVSNIELLLNYCLRFYDRQFITREEINHSVVKKFIEQLDEYISTKALRDGLPTVAYFADKCCLSNGYFGNLVRVETGRTAKDIIADHVLAYAKQLLNDEALTITMISNRLGFEYPQHFVRFFKSHTGKTPSAFRNESIRIL